MTKHNLTLKERLEQKTKLVEGGCQLWTGTISLGYGTITVAKKTLRVHRLVYELFCGEVPKGMHVLHKCDIRNCINPDHLFLGTNDDNVQDKVAKGRQAKGAGTGMAKLTEDEVLVIRQAGLVLSTRKIAKKFGISKSQAHLIVSGSAWKHLN